MSSNFQTWRVRIDVTDENIIRMHGSDYCFIGSFWCEVDLLHEYVLQIEPITFQIYTCDGEEVFNTENDDNIPLTQLGFFTDVITHWIHNNYTDIICNKAVDELSRFQMNRKNYYE